MKTCSVRSRGLTHTISNESGMGVLQMLMLVAVSGVVIASIASALVNMMKSTQTVAQALEQDLFQDQLAQVLADPTICTANLTPYTPDLTGSVATPMSFNLPFAAGTLPIVVGQPISENFKIAAVTNKITAGSGNGFVYNAAPYQHYDSTLSIQLEKTNTATYVQSMKPFDVHLDVVVNAGGQAVGCSAVSAGSAACMAEGGVWNPLAADGEKCLALKFCQYGGSYADAADADGGFINTLSGGRSCPAGFTPQQSGTINKAQGTGKYTVANYPSKIYTCMKCGTAVSPGGPAYPASVPQADLNQEAYDAVAYSQENEARLAEAETEKARQDWQAGVALSNSYQAQIDSANNTIANANAAIGYYQTAEASANADYNAASNDYNAAAAAAPPDSAGMSSAQSAMNSASAAAASAQQGQQSAANQIPPAQSTVNYYTPIKQAQDIQNANLYQIYLQKKAISDQLRARAIASAAAAAAGQEPVD